MGKPHDPPVEALRAVFIIGGRQAVQDCVRGTNWRRREWRRLVNAWELASGIHSLDLMATTWGISRHPGESDQSLRSRMVKATKAP